MSRDETPESRRPETTASIRRVCCKLLLGGSPQIFLCDYGLRIRAEYRNGPEITCEATVIKAPDGWIIDEIRTLPSYQGKGHAQAVIGRLVEISGMPVIAASIDPAAIGFWERMAEKGLCCAPSWNSFDA